MTERQILFSAPMVRALLAGTKSQTRRVVKTRADKDMGPRCQLQPHELAGEVNDGSYRNAYCAPGDRLWVREAWRTESLFNNLPPRELGQAFAPVQYEAGPCADVLDGKLRPGMFMPRWASRITLHVTGVRVERLHDISRGDAMAEGCPFANMAAGPDPRQWYAELWDQINGPGAWGANPWVWAMSFKVVAR